MKKIISGLTILSMLLVMLASCSLNGTPVSLVGVWKRDGAIGGYIEITKDDQILAGSTKGSMRKMCEIKKCTCDEITLIEEGVESTGKYELSGDTLTLTYNGSELKLTREK